MFAAYLVYISILLILIFGFYFDSRPRHIGGWLALIIVSLLLGFRYNVGIDYETYLECYLYTYYTGTPSSSFEFGYTFLNNICARCNLHPGLFFSLIVFLQLTPIYLALRGNRRLLIYAFVFYILTGTLFGALNIQRQALSLSIFIYALQYIQKRNLIKYLICILVATSIHYSSLILVPAYWFPYIQRFKLFEKPVIQLVLYWFVVYFSDLLFDKLLNSTESLLSQTIYFNYVPNLGDRLMKVNSGIGIIFFILVDSVIILYSKKIGESFENFRTYYPIFFIGIILSRIFGIDMLLSRIPYCFVSLRFICVSLLLMYLMSRKKLGSTILYLSIMILFVAIFVVDIFNGSSGCAPYEFIDF